MTCPSCWKHQYAVLTAKCIANMLIKYVVLSVSKQLTQRVTDHFKVDSFFTNLNHDIKPSSIQRTNWLWFFIIYIWEASITSWTIFHIIYEQSRLHETTIHTTRKVSICPNLKFLKTRIQRRLFRVMPQLTSRKGRQKQILFRRENRLM